MSKAVKGLLLSGLVLPGLGQMFLKHYLRGVVFMLAAMGGLAAIMIQAARTALDIVDKIDLNREVVGLDQLLDATNQATASIHAPIYRYAFLLILVSWLLSAVDAYRVGKRLDRQAAAGVADSSGNHQ